MYKGKQTTMTYKKNSFIRRGVHKGLGDLSLFFSMLCEKCFENWNEVGRLIELIWLFTCTCERLIFMYKVLSRSHLDARGHLRLHWIIASNAKSGASNLSIYRKFSFWKEWLMIKLNIMMLASYKALICKVFFPSHICVWAFARISMLNMFNML